MSKTDGLDGLPLATTIGFAVLTAVLSTAVLVGVIYVYTLVLV